MVVGPLQVILTQAACESGTYTQVGSYTINYNSPTGATTSACYGDSRRNSVCVEPWQTAAVYCTPDESVEVWGISNVGIGYHAFTTSPDQILAADVPEENTLVDSSADGQIRLYMLTGGKELQVNAPMGDDINGYVFIWGGCGTVP